jgi:elongation factor Ts
MTNIPIALIAQLRKTVPVSLLRAKKALLLNGRDLTKAIAWLEKDSLDMGLHKSEKVSSRVAAEGLIGLTLDPNRRKGALIEVNCETDFVARSPNFADLCTRVGNSHLFYEHMDENAPLIHLDHTTFSDQDKVVSIKEAIVTKIGELGEKIKLGRVGFLKVSATKGVIGGYMHTYSNSRFSNLGRIGGLVSLNYESANVLSDQQLTNLATVADRIAQHITGFNPQSISPLKDSDSSNALMCQAFLANEYTVEEKLEREKSNNGLDRLWISNFYRMEVGEGIIKQESNFSQEVQAQARLNSAS